MKKISASILVSCLGISLTACAGGQGSGGFAKDHTTFTSKDKAGNTITTTTSKRGSGTAKMATSAALFGLPGLIGYGFYHHSQKNKDKALARLDGALEKHPSCRQYTNSYEATVNCLNSYGDMRIAK